MDLFLNCKSPRGFSYIGRNRDHSSTQLVAKSIILSFRELFQQLIDIYNEFSSFLPSFQFLKLKLKILHFFSQIH